MSVSMLILQLPQYLLDSALSLALGLTLNMLALQLQSLAVHRGHSITTVCKCQKVHLPAVTIVAASDSIVNRY